MFKESRIVRDLAIIIMLVACAAVGNSDPAFAFRRGAAPSATPTVILASVTNTFGNRTIAGYGEERLSRTDQNYGARYHPYGTGILVSGSCSKWSTAVLHGNAAYWNVISHVDEGVNAVTPNLTAAGVTAQAGGAGTTTDFTVTCEDASGNAIASTTFSYLINDGISHCGAVNIGSTDRTDVNYFPSGFGNSIDGCYVQMSTGYVKPSRFVIGMPFAKRVYLTQADPSRPGELQNIETGSNSTNAIMKNIMVLGSKTNGVGNAAFVLGGTNISADNIHRFATQAMRTLGTYQCILVTGTGATTPQTITNYGCEWVGGFYTPATNYTFRYGWSRYDNGDAIIAPGYIHDFHIWDTIIASFHTPASPGIHPDTFQQSDGATLWNYDVQRMMVIPGDSDMGSQGPYFGGGPTGAGDSSTGYVSDSTCSGAAGQTWCVVTGGMQTNGNGTKVYSPDGGSPMGLTDGVTVNCGGTPCPFGAGTKYTLVGLPGNITLGSAAYPIHLYGIVGNNQVWDGIWHAGLYIQGTFPSGSAGTSSIKHFTHNYAELPGVTSIGAPRLSYTNCETSALWTGTLTVSNGAEWNVVTNSNPSLCGGATGVPPNTTQTNVLQAAGNATTLGTWYVSGDPKPCIEALTASASSMSIQQMAVAYATCTIPKVGGPLDLGGGQYAGAQTTALTPTWFDGTPMGNGFAGW